MYHITVIKERKNLYIYIKFGDKRRLGAQPDREWWLVCKNLQSAVERWRSQTGESFGGEISLLTAIRVLLILAAVKLVGVEVSAVRLVGVESSISP